MDTLKDLTRELETSQLARSFSHLLRHVGNHLGDSTRTPPILALHKAAVPPLSTSDLPAAQAAARAWLTIAEKRTILGQLGAVKAPPFVPVAIPTGAPTPVWVGEGLPIPAVRIPFTSETTAIGKLAFILAFTKELIRSSDDRALGLIERISMNALRKVEDQALLSSDAAVAQTKPAGLLYNVPPIAVGSPADLAGALEALLSAVSDGDAGEPRFITSPRAAVWLQGQGEAFDDVAAFGAGRIANIPQLVSAAAGDKLVLVDSARVLVVDEGLEIARAESAAIEMDDAPTSGARPLVSGFQNNLAFVRVVRMVWWALASDDAIGYVQLPIGGSPA
jgi:hypothetical protein